MIIDHTYAPQAVRVLTLAAGCVWLAVLLLDLLPKLDPEGASKEDYEDGRHPHEEKG